MTEPVRHPSRLVVVSNRGPYALRVTKKGIRRDETSDGLVTSLLPLIERHGGVWISWGDPPGHYVGRPGRPAFDLRFIELTPDQVSGYYSGFSNNALWPLCHYFLGRVHYDESEWQTYEQVNAEFARAVLEEARSDDVIWVHDYHLARVPHHLRRMRPNARLIFFWHIPFPSAELFRTLPWRHSLLESLLACDLIGFHIPEYVRNFVESATEVLGARLEEGHLLYAGHKTRVVARPFGIDCDAVSRTAHARRTHTRMLKLRELLHGHKIILGVERLDYTKGIVERLQAIERLLECRPELYGVVTYIQIVTPSRNDVEAYQLKKREIDEIVGRINGRFSNDFWMPVRYLCHAISPAELIAYYRAADIALVTPLRDGLNLVAKEYVAARVDGDGVLILSEFAGVAQQLTEAILVNPYNTQDMVAALSQALQMPIEEQQRRMWAMQRRVCDQDIDWWAAEFLDHMMNMPQVRTDRIGIPRFSRGIPATNRIG